MCGLELVGPLALLVQAIRKQLRARDSRQLPAAALLTQWPDLEASACKALDLEASIRIALVLHAKDPMFLGSSRGDLVSTLAIVTSWSVRGNARQCAFTES